MLGAMRFFAQPQPNTSVPYNAMVVNLMKAYLEAIKFGLENKPFQENAGSSRRRYRR